MPERIVAQPDEIEALEVVPQGNGIEIRAWLSSERSDALIRRRRYMAGPVGCGLCGIDSLEEAIRPIAPVGRKGRI